MKCPRLVEIAKLVRILVTPMSLAAKSSYDGSTTQHLTHLQILCDVLDDEMELSGTENFLRLND